MTEVPEHLLARSRARREAAGLATPSEGGAAPAPSAGRDPAAVETVAATPTPAPATAPPPPPPPKPDPPYVQAYKNRKRIPIWAMPALLMLPLWAFIYANTLETPPKATAGPLAEGAKIFQTCASCHGASGEGGVGPSFQNGELQKSWPNYKDQIRWVSLGSAGWPGDTYGAQNKPKKGGMPAWSGQLTPLQIAEVVRYEREVLGGLAPEPELVAITEGTSPPLDKDGNPTG